MATRPVFAASGKSPYYSVFIAEFEWAGGFALSQKQKNCASMHRRFSAAFPGKRALEVSTGSTEEWGVGASAFNLRKFVPSLNRAFPVENVYQSSKVFSGGGPYTDLLECTPRDAKRDERLRSSGKLVSFRFEGVDHPLEPKNAFYDFIYVNALIENPSVAEKLLGYDGFTDVSFNPEKNLNCQARAAAIYVSLVRLGLIGEAKTFDGFAALFTQKPSFIQAQPRETE